MKGQYSDSRVMWKGRNWVGLITFISGIGAGTIVYLALWVVKNPNNPISIISYYTMIIIIACLILTGIIYFIYPHKVEE